MQESAEKAQDTEQVQELSETIPESLSTTTYWVMGATGALLLFASILAHEFGHAIVANRRGLPVRGITLFLFGGVAELSREPDSAKNEFWMAIAGPIVSVVLGVGFFVLAAFPLPAAVWMVVQYLAIINIVVVVFNMIPAYPLDGGRVLRSILWGWKGDLRKATRTAAGIGAGFGLVLMILAGVRLLYGDFIGAAFTFLIGMFIRGASGQARQQIEIRTALSGKPVRELMNDQPRTVSADEPLDRFVDDHVYRHHLKMFPVTQRRWRSARGMHQRRSAQGDPPRAVEREVRPRPRRPVQRREHHPARRRRERGPHADVRQRPNQAHGRHPLGRARRRAHAQGPHGPRPDASRKSKASRVKRTLDGEPASAGGGDCQAYAYCPPAEAGSPGTGSPTRPTPHAAAERSGWYPPPPFFGPFICYTLRPAASRRRFARRVRPQRHRTPLRTPPHPPRDPLAPRQRTVSP